MVHKTVTSTTVFYHYVVPQYLAIIILLCIFIIDSRSKSNTLVLARSLVVWWSTLISSWVCNLNMDPSPSCVHLASIWCYSHGIVNVPRPSQFLILHALVPPCIILSTSWKKKKHGRLGNEAKVDCDLRAVRHSPFMDQAQMLIFNTMQNKDRSLNKYNNEHLNTGPLSLQKQIGCFNHSVVTLRA